MSLFPSAVSASSSSTSETAGTSNRLSDKNWLENKSFTSDAANLLRSNHSRHAKETSDDFQEATLESNETSDDTNQSTLQLPDAIDYEFTQRKLSTKSDGDTSDDDDDAKVNAVPSNSNAETVLDFKIKFDKTPDQNNVYFNKPYKVTVPKYYREAYACIGLSRHMQIVFEKDRKKKKRKTFPRYYHFDEDVMHDPDRQGEDMASDFKTRVEKLNIKTREDKTDVDAWMELVNLQDEILGRNVKLRTEKKVAILDKAIGANSRNYHLKLKRLQLLESISEDSDREWKNLVFQHPDCKEAWLAYVKHTLTSSRFTVPRTLKVFEKCLETLSSIRKQGYRSEEFVESVEEDMIEIFTKLVQFLVESGHTERTVALLQMMLEINVRAQSVNDLSVVESFYESGLPLLGEPDSTGWMEWHQKFQRGGWIQDSRRIEKADDEMEVDDVIDFDKSVNENWLNVETKRSRCIILPWRSEEECEDPGRKINYEDIKGFLFLVNKDSSRLKLFQIFLQVFGAMPENLFANQKILLGQPCQVTHALQCCDVLGDISVLQPITCSGCKSQGVLPRVPHHEFLQEVFEQLASSNLQNIKSEIGVLCIGYYIARLTNLKKLPEFKSELKKTYKSARKLAKILLKSNPGDFMVWSKLAKVEFLAQNIEECKKVTFNSLVMCKNETDALLLCRNFAELLSTIEKESVKRTLSALGDGRNFASYLQQNKEISAAALLRSSRSLERMCEEMGCVYQQVELNRYGEPSPFANAVCCHILNGMINEASISTDMFLKYLNIFRTAKANGNDQALVDFRLIHSLNIRSKVPDYLRDNAYRKALLLALEDLPDHPPFLQQLCQIEIGSSLTSIARRILSSSTNPIHIFYSVYFELLRIQNSPQFQTLVPPRVLNTLERAVCVLSDNTFLWRLYAKLSPNPYSILSRSVGYCPWSKTLACDRIRLEKEKIEEIISFMNDKGLRVRTPVEEINLLITL